MGIEEHVMSCLVLDYTGQKNNLRPPSAATSFEEGGFKAPFASPEGGARRAGVDSLRIPLRASARRGYALASVVTLMFFLTVILGVAVSHLDYSYAVTEARLKRVQARNALESMTNLSLKWLASEVKKGARPRVQAIDDLKELTEFDSLRIFTFKDYDGREVNVYDLDCPTVASHVLPLKFPGGYMIRAVVEEDASAPLMLESVYAVTLVTVPGGSAVEVLDEKPVYSREIFRN